MPKRSQTKTKTWYVIYGASVLLAMIIAAQSAVIWQLSIRTNQLQNQDLKTISINAVRNLNTDLAVDPQTGRHYLPSLRLVLPAKLEAPMYYRDGGDNSSVVLMSAANQLQAMDDIQTAKTSTDIYNQVNELQKCSRQVVISINQTHPLAAEVDKLTLKATKHLSDGRTAYVYQNDCPLGAEPLLRSLDQLQSY